MPPSPWCICRVAVFRTRPTTSRRPSADTCCCCHDSMSGTRGLVHSVGWLAWTHPGSLHPSLSPVCLSRVALTPPRLCLLAPPCQCPARGPSGQVASQPAKTTECPHRGPPSVSPAMPFLNPSIQAISSWGRLGLPLLGISPFFLPELVLSVDIPPARPALPDLAETYTSHLPVGSPTQPCLAPVPTLLVPSTLPLGQAQHPP